MLLTAVFIPVILPSRRELFWSFSTIGIDAADVEVEGRIPEFFFLINENSTLAE
jgi:hypothetical protein